MEAVGPNINVPEFNDCQRFIRYVDDTARYDSLFAIFATANLISIDTTIDSGYGVTGVVAAEIYAEGAYAPLGIKRTFNCLYLFFDTQWHAVMVTRGETEPNCSGAFKRAHDTVETQLEVHREVLKGFAPSDIPPVARWDWDTLNHEQYIGIKCGNTWCDVGRQGFHSTQPDDQYDGKSLKYRRAHLIKGWFDSQYLADTNAKGKVVPSDIWGVIYPDEALDDDDITHTFLPGKRVPVAQVELSRPGEPAPISLAQANLNNPYKKSLNVDMGKPRLLLGTHLFSNTIYLCRGDKSTCGANVARPCDGDGLWWGRLLDSRNIAKDMCMVRRAHEGLGSHVPGTARWRWLASDETTWKRCDNGCCELH